MIEKFDAIPKPCKLLENVRFGFPLESY